MNFCNIAIIGMIDDFEHTLYFFFGRLIDCKLDKYKIQYRYLWNNKILTILILQYDNITKKSQKIIIIWPQ